VKAKALPHHYIRREKMYKKLQKLQIQKEENGREKEQNRLATNNRTTRPYNRADALRELQSHSSQPAQIQKKGHRA
jgi:hypothetical protein